MKASLTIAFTLPPEGDPHLAAYLGSLLEAPLELGMAFEIRLGLRDPRIEEILSALEEGKLPYAVYETRRFETREIAEAPALRITLPVIGQETLLETDYDLEGACALCLEGREQRGDLVLEEDLDPAPGIALTPSGQLLVNERLARRMIADHIEGCILRGVQTRTGSASSLFQVVGFHTLPSLHSPPTRFVVDEEKRCPLCDRGGLSVCSMLYYDAPEDAFSDLNLSEERIGIGTGQHPEIVVSQRFFRMLAETEGVHFATEPVMLV